MPFRDVHMRGGFLNVKLSFTKCTFFALQTAIASFILMLTIDLQGTLKMPVNFISINICLIKFNFYF